MTIFTSLDINSFAGQPLTQKHQAINATLVLWNETMHYLTVHAIHVSFTSLVFSSWSCLILVCNLETVIISPRMSAKFLSVSTRRVALK